MSVVYTAKGLYLQSTGKHVPNQIKILRRQFKIVEYTATGRISNNDIKLIYAQNYFLENPREVFL